MVKTKFNNNCRGEVPSPCAASPIIKGAPVEGKSETEKNKGGETPPLQKNLPERWVKTSMNNVCTIILGQSPPSATYNTNDEGLPFFQGKAEFGERYPTVIKYCSTPKKTAEKNDILISVRAPVGPTNIAPSKCCIGRGLAAIRPLEGAESLYIFYFLRSIEHELSEMGTGTTFKAISGSDLRAIQIPLAPLDQQKIIVAEIEKQFSRLDEAVVALKRIQVNLKRYKASVLKAAVEGKLTEKWRSRRGEPMCSPCVLAGQTHRSAPTKDKTGEDLLKRILVERRKKWEEDYIKKYVEVHGREPKDDSWKNKYKEPTAPDTSNLPELPKGWIWVRLGQLIDEPKYGTSKKCDYETDGIGVLRIPNIVNGFVDNSDLKFAEFDEDEIKTYRLQEGDILTIRSNGSVSLVGKCALVSKSDEKYLYAGYLIKMRPLGGVVHSEYLMICLSSLSLRKQIEAKAKSTSGVNNINAVELGSLMVPICRKEEQKEIIRIVDEKLSDIEHLWLEADSILKRAERLRQSILKKAFSGKLV